LKGEYVCGACPSYGPPGILCRCQFWQSGCAKASNVPDPDYRFRCFPLRRRCCALLCVAATVTCTEDRVLCANMEHCLSDIQFCNGADHCGDNWDEDTSVCGKFLHRLTCCIDISRISYSRISEYLLCIYYNVVTVCFAQATYARS